MASVRKQIVIDTDPHVAWAALQDWGALHTRLAPGFVIDLQLDGTDRLITLFNGVVVRERLVSMDEDERRLVWSIIDDRYAHHNGAAQVTAEGDDRTLFSWTADFLPDELAPTLDQVMERGIQTIKQTLEQAGRARSDLPGDPRA